MFKRTTSLMLVVVMVALQLLSGAISAFAASTAAMTDTSFNGEGVWITEIYNNDVDRSEKNNTRDTSGYIPVDLFASASDLMEYVEICSTHDSNIKFNDLYEFYIDGIRMTVTNAAGGTDITLTKGQPVVLWNYRTDIVMPTEAQLRSALRIPENAMVLRVNYGSNWAAASGTFTIKSKATGKDVSSFTALLDTHTKDGMAVELKMPVMKSSAMEVYRALNLPSAGRVYSAQLNGCITANIPSGYNGKGVYITEVRPNDISRSSTYGTTSDVMECFEITNTTDQDVDLNTQYRVMFTVKEGFRKPLTIYKYSSSAQGHIGSSSKCIVPAGGTVVLWCYRESYLTDATSYPTLSQFRSAYGLTTDNKVYLFKDQNGLTNDNRSIELFKLNADGSLGELVSGYSYLGDADCADGLSAQLKINPEGPNMLLQEANAATTMGTVDAEQLKYVKDDGSAMELWLYDGWEIPEYVMQGQDLRVFFYYNNPGKLTRLFSDTYYRFDGTGEWIRGTEGGIRVPNRYETVIPAYELFDHDYVEFYACTGNEYRTTYRGVYKVNIKKINDVDGIRTNIIDGEEVSGTIAITANDGTTKNSNTKIYIDGVKQTTTPMLEDGGYYTFVVDGLDSYFRTAITTNKDKLITHIGKWAFESLVKQVRHIDSSYFTYKSSSDTYTTTLRFWAGTYGTYATDNVYPDANREDFSVTNLKLKLANGKEYLPSKIGPSSYNGVDTSGKTNLSTTFDAVHYIGDGSNRCPYMDVTFTIPASEVTSVGVKLDTTTLSEGTHTLKVTNGTDSQIITFIVDNTAPAVDLGIAKGSSVTGEIVLNPQITDANNINEFVTCLDGEPISIPYETTAYAMGQGNHTLTVYAKDAAGNEKEVSTTFVVEDVSMFLNSGETGNITHNSATVQLNAYTKADAQVSIYKGQTLTDIQATQVQGAVPYLRYSVDASGAQLGDDIVVSWSGSASNADSGHKITMFVKNTATDRWEPVAVADSTGKIKNASFPAKDHLLNGKADIVVQCVAENAMPDLDPGTDGKANQNSGWDGSGRPVDYDFSFAWLSDTQNYVQKYQEHFLHMNQWIVDNQEEWKIKYMIHTGDIVDDWDTMYQWENSDEGFKIFEDAGLQYGVLAGNHDVASGLDQRENYYQYFGEDRFQDQYVYGESFQNNHGHYDLVSENGQDFIVIYMSWNTNEAEVNWMNEVLAKHRDRKAILCFHAYTHVRESVDGLLDYWGVMVQNQVVAKNPNVFAVLNGHYAGATYQTVRFDDNGDGKKDRTVYQICTDYQDLSKGGLEYIKFLYFDLDSDKVYINSYSPYLDDFNYYDTPADDLAALAAKQSNGVVNKVDIDAMILDLNFSVDNNAISQNSFSAALYTDELLGTASMDATSGNAKTELKNLTSGTEHQWYAVLENADSGYLRTDLYSFTTQQAPADPVLTLKSPTLEFKDMITVNAMFTAENLDNVVEMGMITYTQKVDVWSVDTANHVISGTTYDETTGRYIAHSQGIHAKYLGDTVYLAVYAKLNNGSYVYSKLASYSPVQYATNQLKNSADLKLKQLVVAMLNYGAAAQTHFNHNVLELANGGLTSEQIGLPESYRSDMVSTVASPSVDKQGVFVNNKGFAKKYPSISFEGAFCINYFFTPSYVPVDGITLYYWNAADYESAEVLTVQNASGSMKMDGQGTGEYRGDLTGISAKTLSEAVYVAAVYSDGTSTWSSGVLGYSIGAYCASQSTKGGTIADLAMATAVYGYQAKQYFG